MPLPLIAAVPLIVAPVAVLWGAKAVQTARDAAPAPSGPVEAGGGSPGVSGGGAGTVIGGVEDAFDQVSEILDRVLPDVAVGRRSTGAPIPEGAPREIPDEIEAAADLPIEDGARREPVEAGATQASTFDRVTSQTAAALGGIVERLQKAGR